MRNCSACHAEDRPWFEDAPCSCGIPEGPDAGNPYKHSPDCKSLSHEVVRYPIRMEIKDLNFDKTLSRYYVQRGWELLQNGMRYYRVKMLCRKCIGLEVSAQERKREYEKACKAARGDQTETYAQMLARQ